LNYAGFDIGIFKLYLNELIITRYGFLDFIAGSHFCADLMVAGVEI